MYVDNKQTPTPFNCHFNLLRAVSGRAGDPGLGPVLLQAHQGPVRYDCLVHREARPGLEEPQQPVSALGAASQAAEEAQHQLGHHTRRVHRQQPATIGDTGQYILRA